VFSDSEREEDSVIRNFRVTAADGKSDDIPTKASNDYVLLGKDGAFGRY
jgi:hypothetical protein